MKTAFLKIIFVFLFGILLIFTAHAQKVVVLNLDSPIYPSTASYIQKGLQRAGEEKANCVILKINTPGGLLKPTRKMVGTIMQSPIPVISFVAPSGAHAGSAGSFISVSADIAAMAPGTNIGAAHPVGAGGKDIKGVMNEKITNDAVAFIQAIAEKRHRDTTLLKEMVTNSRSFSAKEALQKNIINLMANNLPDLLTKLDHKQLQLLNGKTVTLHTEGATVKTITLSNRTHFLNILNNPNVMYILLLLGLLGVLFEIFNPGGFVPGIVGVVCLILAGYGMTVLPVSFTGLALIGLAIVLFLLELKFASYGILTLGGTAALFLGAVFLIKSSPSFDVITLSWSVIITSVVVVALFFIFIIGLGLRAQLTKKKTGREGMIGQRGRVVETLSPEGRVKVRGEIWKAQTEVPPVPVQTEVEVIAIKDFQLVVKPVSLTT